MEKYTGIGRNVNRRMFEEIVVWLFHILIWKISSRWCPLSFSLLFISFLILLSLPSFLSLLSTFSPPLNVTPSISLSLSLSNSFSLSLSLSHTHTCCQTSADQWSMLQKQSWRVYVKKTVQTAFFMIKVVKSSKEQIRRWETRFFYTTNPTFEIDKYEKKCNSLLILIIKLNSNVLE